MISCRRSKLSDNRGFTLLEVVLVLILAGVLTATGMSYLADNGNAARFEQTRQQMEAIKVAMIGDPALKNKGQRTTFGYAGDWGALPGGISNLVTAQVPAWSYNSTYGFGAGWKGSYLTNTFNSVAPTTDGWGRTFIVDTASDPATITSRGADGAAGGTGFDTDLVVEIPTRQWRGNVRGKVLDGTSAQVGAIVEIRYPVAGVMTAFTNTTDANGAFVFSNVPFGIRSLRVTSPTVINVRQIVVDTSEVVIDSSVLNYQTTASSASSSVSRMCCRLSTDSTEPVTTSDQTNQSRVYLHPYNGNIIPLYTGSTWANYSLSSAINVSLSGSTGQILDVFVYYNGTSLTLALGTAWTNDTTRAVALGSQDGVLVLSTDTTRRYVGTVRLSNNNRTEDSLERRYVWNYYNRIQRPLYTADPGNWSYSTATWRAAGGDCTNRVQLVVGTTDALVDLKVTIRGYNSSGAVHYVGIADMQSEPSGGTCNNMPSTADINGINRSTFSALMEAFLKGRPAIGMHSYQWVENGGGTATTSFEGGGNMGIHGSIDG